MRQRLTLVEHCRPVRTFDGSTVDIVQHPFGKVGCGREIFQALLVLNADRVAAELVGDAQSGDVHFALLEYLVVRQFGRFVHAGLELNTRGRRATGARLALRHQSRVTSRHRELTG